MILSGNLEMFGCLDMDSNQIIQSLIIPGESYLVLKYVSFVLP